MLKGGDPKNTSLVWLIRSAGSFPLSSQLLRSVNPHILSLLGYGSGEDPAEDQAASSWSDLLQVSALSMSANRSDQWQGLEI